MTPTALADAIGSGRQAMIAIGMTPTMADRLLALSAEEVRHLEKVDTPDLVGVEVDLGEDGDPRWPDIERVSPGQAATAMLSLALVSGTEPIIIDQPEDDLDNRYIYEEVVQLLAEVTAR